MDLPRRLYAGRDVKRLYEDLLAARVTADAVAFGSPVALTVGGGNVDGTSDAAARADHKHSLPAFGTGAGTFAEGNDARFWPGMWAPGAAPTSPHSQDDEFTGSSGLWTVCDAGAYVTFALDATRRMLRASGTGNGGRQQAYYAQAVPGSEFAIYTRVGLQPYAGATGVTAGLFVGQDVITDPTNSDVRVLTNYGSTTNAGVASATFTTYNAAPVAVQSRDPMVAPWLRVRQNGTSYEADFSVDGLDWRRISTQTLAFSPTHFGLVFESVNANPGVAYFDFFRVFEGAGTSAADGTFIGRYLG